MHPWKHKDIKHETVKFTFLIHFVLVLIFHREVRSEWFCGWFRKFRNYLTTQTQVSNNFLKDTVFSLMLNMEQDLQQWPWHIRALWEEGGLNTFLDLPDCSMSRYSGDHSALCVPGIKPYSVCFLNGVDTSGFPILKRYRRMENKQRNATYIILAIGNISCIRNKDSKTDKYNSAWEQRILVEIW